MGLNFHSNIKTDFYHYTFAMALSIWFFMSSGLWKKENYALLKKNALHSRAGNRTPATAVKTPDPNH